MVLEDTIQKILPMDTELISRAQARLDGLTKPVGSLGRLEELACHYVAMRGEEPKSTLKSRVLTLAADHGVVEEGVSAYPSSVTAQMVKNFLNGGAAVNVLARHVGADVQIVDMGVLTIMDSLPGLVVRKVGLGTNNFVLGPAMTHDQARQSVEIGIELAHQAYEAGFNLLATGEMGIGNTTSSAAITAVMTNRSVRDVTGHGTGVDEEGWERKVHVIEQALAIHRLDSNDSIDVLAKVGGFEIGGLTGIILGAAACRIPVVLDGFIAGASALLAVGLQPDCRDYLFASHRSAEQGHQVLLDRLTLRPLLDLNLRLGEGTGACLAIGLIAAALKIYTEMATFEEAGVDTASPSHQEAR